MSGDFYDYLGYGSTGFDPQYGNEDLGYLDLDKYNPDEYLDLDSYQPEEKSWWDWGWESFLPDIDFVEGMRQYNTRRTQDTFSPSMRYQLGEESPDMSGRVANKVYGSAVQPMVSPFGIPLAVGSAVSAPIATASAIGFGAHGLSQIPEASSRAYNDPSFENLFDLGMSAGMVAGGIHGIGRAIDPLHIKYGQTPTQRGVAAKYGDYGAAFTWDRAQPKPPVVEPPIPTDRSMVPTGPIEPNRGSTRPLEHQPQTVTIYSRATIPYYEAQGYVEVPGMRDHNGNPIMVLASDLDTMYTPDPPRPDLPLNQPPVPEGDLPLAYPEDQPIDLGDSPGRTIADDILMDVNVRDKYLQRYVQSTDKPIFNADPLSGLFDQAAGIGIADNVDPRELTRPQPFPRGDWNIDPLGLNDMTSSGFSLNKQRDFEDEIRGMYQGDMVTSGDWSKRPHPRAVRGDEAIPELAFQPDEGKVTEYDTNEQAITGEGREVFGGITRAEANRLREETPEGWVNSATIRFPELRDEALSLYYEREPERISQNLAHHAAAEQAAWKPFFKESNNRAHNRPTMSNEEYNELSFTHSRAKALMEIAQSIYERTSGRMVEGRSDTRKKMGGSGYFTGNEPDFFAPDYGDMFGLRGTDVSSEGISRRPFKEDEPGSLFATGGNEGAPPPNKFPGLRSMSSEDLHRILAETSPKNREYIYAIQLELRLRGATPAPKIDPSIPNPANIPGLNYIEDPNRPTPEEFQKMLVQRSQEIKAATQQNELNKQSIGQMSDIAKLDEMMKQLIGNKSTTPDPTKLVNQGPPSIREQLGIPPDQPSKSLREQEIEQETDINVLLQEFRDFRKAAEDAHARGDHNVAKQMEELRDAASNRLKELGHGLTDTAANYKNPYSRKMARVIEDLKARGVSDWEYRRHLGVHNQGPLIWEQRVAANPNATVEYRLPDGEIVKIREDVARGQRLVSFTLKGGEIVNARRLKGTDTYEKRLKQQIDRMERWYQRDLKEAAELGVEVTPDMDMGELSNAIQRERLVQSNIRTRQRMVNRGEQMPLGILESDNSFSEGFGGPRETHDREQIGEVRNLREEDVENIAFAMDWMRRAKAEGDAAQVAELERSIADVLKLHEDLGHPIQPSEVARAWAEVIERDTAGKTFEDTGETDRVIQNSGDAEVAQLMKEGADRMALEEQGQGRFDYNTGNRFPDSFAGGSPGGDDWMNQMNNRLNKPYTPPVDPAMQQSLPDGITPTGGTRQIQDPQRPPPTKRELAAYDRQVKVNSAIELEHKAREMETRAKQAEETGNQEEAFRAGTRAAELREKARLYKLEIRKHFSEAMKESEKFESMARIAEREGRHDDAARLKAQAETEIAHEAGQLELQFRKSRVAERAELMGFELTEETKQRIDNLDPNMLRHNIDRSFADLAIASATKGPPGVDVVDVTPDRKFMQEFELTIRDKEGNPIAYAEVVRHPVTGRGSLEVFASKNGVSPIHILELAHELNKMDSLVPDGPYSVHTLNFLKRLRELLKDESGAMQVPQWLLNMPATVGRQWDRIKNYFGIGKGRGNIPPSTQHAQMTMVDEMFALPKNLLTGADASYPLRQGMALATTPQFWRALLTMFPGATHPIVYRMIRDHTIRHNRIFNPGPPDPITGLPTPSIAERGGFELHDVPSSPNAPAYSNRMQSVASKWIEDGEFFNTKIPWVTPIWKWTAGIPYRAGNRAYVTMGNTLRAYRAQFLMDMHEKASMNAISKLAHSTTGPIRQRVGWSPFGQKVSTYQEAFDMNPYYNIERAKEIFDTVDTLTGASKLRGKFLGKEYNFEAYARHLGKIFIAPGMAHGRFKMTHLATYTQASPQIRREYLRGLMSVAAMWIGGLGMLKTLADAMGVKNSISYDPFSADFMKLRIGQNFRMDPGGGFQQFIVWYARMGGGWYTSARTGVTEGLGEGFRAGQTFDLTTRFVGNKLEPMSKLLFDLSRATAEQPVHMYDRTAQLFFPLAAQDLWEIQKEDPNLLPFALPMFFGWGTQIYGGGESVGKFIDPKNDWIIQSGTGRGILFGTDYPSSATRPKNQQQIGPRKLNRGTTGPQKGIGPRRLP